MYHAPKFFIGKPAKSGKFLSMKKSEARNPKS